jgi:hypothetical protein
LAKRPFPFYFNFRRISEPMRSALFISQNAFEVTAPAKGGGPRPSVEIVARGYRDIELSQLREIRSGRPKL